MRPASRPPGPEGASPRAAAWRIVEVDGHRFELAPGDPPRVRLPDGALLPLPPWPLSARLDALARHLRWHEDAAEVDAPALLAELLAACEAPAQHHELLAPLMWWWAAGADPGPTPEPHGWLRLDEKTRVRLRPWTSAERARALDLAVTRHADASHTFHVDIFLREMVAASVTACEPADAELPAALLDPVVALNLPDAQPLAGVGAELLARATLRLCRALGWTPSQVWAAPAAEVDRLLALLDLSEGTDLRAAPAPRRGLAAYPDAVVIEVTD